MILRIFNPETLPIGNAKKEDSRLPFVSVNRKSGLITLSKALVEQLALVPENKEEFAIFIAQDNDPKNYRDFYISRDPRGYRLYLKVSKTAKWIAFTNAKLADLIFGALQIEGIIAKIPVATLSIELGGGYGLPCSPGR